MNSKKSTSLITVCALVILQATSVWAEASVATCQAAASMSSRVADVVFSKYMPELFKTIGTVSDAPFDVYNIATSVPNARHLKNGCGFNVTAIEDGCATDSS